MQEPLEIRLLGPFEVIAGGAPADVGGSQAPGAARHCWRSACGRMVDSQRTRSTVCGARSSPSAPRNALHHHVARLRATLGETAIAGFPDGYALGNGRVDALRFEELLAEHARCAAGRRPAPAPPPTAEEALGAVEGAGASGARRHGVVRRGSPAPGGRCASTRWRSASRPHSRSASTARADPRAPRPRSPRTRSASGCGAHLMLALYRAGRQAEALETFQEARRVLAEELGLEPGPDLRRLQEAILAHDPAIAAVAAARQPPRQPAGTGNVVRRPGGRHRPRRRAGGSAPSRHADRAAWRGQDPSRRGGRARPRGRLPRRRVARRLRPRGKRCGRQSGCSRTLSTPVASDPLARVTVAAARTRPHCSSSTPASTCSSRQASSPTVLLADCPDLRILATSREALHVAGEARVPCRAAPARGTASVEPVPRASARGAARVRAGRLTQRALAADIARRVDGLPLAIELAAARVNVLGLGEILSILERRASLLHDGAASDPSRHALRSLVEWSYDLLHGDEKTLLEHARRAPGRSFVAVACSLSPEATVLTSQRSTYLAERAGRQVDRLRLPSPDGEARYDLLDTVREYVLEGVCTKAAVSPPCGEGARRVLR